MSLLTAPLNPPPIHDQARELRRLIAKRSIGASSSGPEQSVRRCRSIAIFSGKGGVGKSVVALNLAVAMAQRGESVCLLDATPHVGNLALLCGQNGYWNLAHVAAGTRSLDDILLKGPGGIPIIPGGIHLLENLPGIAATRRALNELECRHDWLIVDTSADVLHFGQNLVAAADCVLCVTTPEPTAVAEAYAGLKSLAAESESVVAILVNQADSEDQASEIAMRLRQAARSFLGSDVCLAGSVPFDTTVRQSVLRREPLSMIEPGCPALLALEHVSTRIAGMAAQRCDRGYFEQLESPFSRRLVRNT